MLQDLAREARLNGTGDSVGEVRRCLGLRYPSAPSPRRRHACEDRTVWYRRMPQGLGGVCLVGQGLRPRMGMRPEKVLGGVSCQNMFLAGGRPRCPEAPHSSCGGLSSSELVCCHAMLGEVSARIGSYDAAMDGPKSACIVAVGCRGHCNVLQTHCTLVRQGPRRAASVASHWRRAGHFAPLAARKSVRFVTHVLSWRDASYKQIARALLWRPCNPSRRRLGTSVMGPPPSRWKDPMQQACNVHASAWTCWREVAQDKETWAALEAAFVQMVVKLVRPTPVPRGRWMVGETPGST